MQHQKNRGQQQHGPDQGQMPNRNRSDIRETPEQDVNTQPRRPGESNKNEKTRDVRQNVTTNTKEVGASVSTPLGEHGQDSRQRPDNQGKIGGQGMGQGRGMNPGEGSTHKPDQENDQKGGDRSDRAAHSGATGERNPAGGQNKSEPKNQDEKGMGHPRNK